MTKVRTAVILGGLIASTVGVNSMWAAGCSNSSLLGTYNAENQNVSLQSVLQGLKPAGGTTTGTGTTGSTGTGSATTTATVVGLNDNANSLAGNQPGLGRFYFDGAGNIVGAGTAATNNAGLTMTVGKYSVNEICTGSITLDSGATYDLVIGSKGDIAAFVRTDSNTGAGDAGSLQRSSSCQSLNYAGNFSFALAGTRKVTAAAGTGDTTTPSATYQAYSAIGTLRIDGVGTFTMTQNSYNNSAVQRATSRGTYTVGQDCSLGLKFDTTTPGASSTNFVAPASFRVQMIDSANGFLSVQTEAGNTLTGSVVAQ